LPIGFLPVGIFFVLNFYESFRGIVAAKDYYNILGITKNTPQNEIKKKYRELAKKYHPDKHKGDLKAEARFKDISEAYDTIGTPEKKQKYDMEKESPFSNHGGGNQGGQGNFGDFGDVFSEFFGGRGGGSSKKSRPSPKLEPIEESIRIPFHLALKGGDYLHRTISGKNVKLKIPSNCPEEHKIPINGIGSSGENVIITVHFVLPETVKLEGLNVIQKLKVSVWDGILGGKQEVRLYDDRKINITIKEGSDSHNRLKLPKFGLKNKNETGDCYLELLFESPKNLTDQQKTLLQSLKYNT
jgi:curved DNA-binding protein